ncbi:hypothetical protein GIB67_041666 [Kingdonia uniflora]|uniref:Uncharacterized protein n=1 Tax=Kingdonia uniflora TaxID=39325 RepID=A0A7J7MQL1_9MAGN|nr:hypothetical protein GIB67_041666 [Kingdonia uniflora]
MPRDPMDEVDSFMTEPRREVTQEGDNIGKEAMATPMNLHWSQFQHLKSMEILFWNCKMNCVQLENCLHEAREQAHTHRCADRRASDYSTLRASAVKMRSLFERFRSCVTALGGVANFVDPLRVLAFSLGKQVTF